MLDKEQKVYQSNSGREKLWKSVIFFALLVWLGVFMAEKIDIATTDLGRHIENGQWVVENHFNLSQKNSPVHENFYSYTNPDFPAINHHWGSGVLLYFIYKLTGFFGLSLFYILFSLYIFAIFFRLAWKNSDFTTAALLSLLLIPLMAERTEIRPEILSYFFSAVFLWALWNWQRGKLATSRLYILPILMILWINLHVYFFIGLFLVGVFWLSEAGQFVFSKLTDEDFSKKVSALKNLSIVLFLSIIASLISPFSLAGLLYPLQIFKNYGYTIVENKSVGFVESYGIVNSNFLLIKIVLIFLLLSFVLVWLADRKKISFVSLILGIFFGTIGWLAIRNFTLLGFVALPILAQNMNSLFSLEKKERSPAKENGLAVVYIFLFLFAAFSSYQSLSNHPQNRGMGLLAGNNQAAQFFKENNIRGPIFNNYDIGGYLIFHLYPGEKVFVDNRPEAYPSSFFKDEYIPMEEDDALWKKEEEKYNFNAIVFSYHDITPWGQSFLKSRLADPEWAPVYKDDYAIIFLRRNVANGDLIKNYQLPAPGN
jgi:hypothetical protein